MKTSLKIQTQFPLHCLLDSLRTCALFSVPSPQFLVSSFHIRAGSYPNANTSTLPFFLTIGRIQQLWSKMGSMRFVSLCGSYQPFYSLRVRNTGKPSSNHSLKSGDHFEAWRDDMPISYIEDPIERYAQSRTRDSAAPTNSSRL